ncbi:MAG: antibiotic biosynthesis monooxygenase [Euryarchaeota archaeon]|nr:antibiotic biosynthesis monooxygenase [Euryarchaeota archaeon]
MSVPIQLVLDAKIKPGQENTLDKVAQNLVPLVEKEKGTLDYRWVRESGTPNVCFFDLYSDSNAFVEHFKNAKGNGTLDDLMACVDITGVTVVGKPEPAAKEILDQFGAKYYEQYAGFSRIAQLQPATIEH